MRKAEDSRRDVRPCLCWTGGQRPRLIMRSRSHSPITEASVITNEREEERALSRINGARHLTLSAPISAQRGAHASTAQCAPPLHTLRAQRFLFSDVLFSDVAHVIGILILGYPYENDRFRHDTIIASYIQPIFHITPTTSVSFQNKGSPNVLPETWSTVPKCI